jgi:hypothetical protein
MPVRRDRFGNSKTEPNAPWRFFVYADWTDENHLRHSKFIALRDDKAAKDVKRGFGGTLHHLACSRVADERTGLASRNLAQGYL